MKWKECEGFGKRSELPLTWNLRPQSIFNNFSGLPDEQRRNTAISSIMNNIVWFDVHLVFNFLILALLKLLIRQHLKLVKNHQLSIARNLSCWRRTLSNAWEFTNESRDCRIRNSRHSRNYIFFRELNSDI